MKIYCLKCKCLTDTTDLLPETTANGRHMMKGSCVRCGTQKAKFVSGNKKGGGRNVIKPLPKPTQAKKQKGGSIIDKLINSGKLPELHYISPFTGKRHSFTGPFTKLEKRLDPNTKKPLPHSQPVNEVDKASYLHDLAYENLKDHASRKHADNAMIDDLNAIYNDKSKHWTTRADAKLVGFFMRGKRWLGLGKNKKRRKL